jgi:hypothetical protein
MGGDRVRAASLAARPHKAALSGHRYRHDTKRHLMTISADDVRRLLQDEHPDAVLVLIEGRSEVIGQSEVDSPQYRGALQVISRDDLLQQIGGKDLSDRLIEEQATILDTTVNELGG